MAWIVVDVALALLGLAVLCLLALRLWRQVRALGREVGAAGERVRTAAAALEELRPPAGSAAPPSSGGSGGVA